MAAGVTPLNVKQEAFCHAYLRLGEAKAAYVEAYGVRGVTAKRLAPDLLADPNVATRIAELREATAERAEITAASLIKELEEDRKLAREANQFNASISATEKIGKLLGLFVDKSETTVSMRPDDARKTVEQLAGKYLPGAGK